MSGADVFGRQWDGTTIAQQYAQLGIQLTCANMERVNGWAEILRRLGQGETNQESPAIRPSLYIHERCARLIECLPNLQHDPNRPEDVGKFDCDEDGRRPCGCVAIFGEHAGAEIDEIVRNSIFDFRDRLKT